MYLTGTPLVLTGTHFNGYMCCAACCPGERFDVVKVGPKVLMGRLKLGDANDVWFVQSSYQVSCKHIANACRTGGAVCPLAPAVGKDTARAMDQQPARCSEYRTAIHACRAHALDVISTRMLRSQQPNSCAAVTAMTNGPYGHQHVACNSTPCAWRWACQNHTQTWLF